MSDETPRRGFWDLGRARSRTAATTERRDSDAVPAGLRVAAAYAWRLLLVAALIAVAVWVVITFKDLVIPLLVAILLSALVWPAYSALRRLRLPKILAITVTLVGLIAIVGGLLWLVIWQIAREAGGVREQAAQMIDDAHEWLLTTGLVTDRQLEEMFAQAGDFIRDQADFLLNGALTLGSTLGTVGTGLLITVFVLICLLADGEPIWKWTLRLFPKVSREAVDAAARGGWRTLINYARTQIIVATIDAIGIGLGAFFLGVPLAIPIAVLVFLGALRAVRRCDRHRARSRCCSRCSPAGSGSASRCSPSSSSCSRSRATSCSRCSWAPPSRCTRSPSSSSSRADR